jgi:hypothetical protein
MYFIVECAINADAAESHFMGQPLNWFREVNGVGECLIPDRAQ